MIINNEVEIAIETLLNGSSSKNEIARAKGILWDWLVQIEYITIDNVGEHRRLMRDVEKIATIAHDELTRLSAQVH